MPTERLPERLMPLAARSGVKAYYGDIHNHCAISYGHGSLEGALENARQQLDFVSVTGHAYWPDMPINDPSVAHIVAFHVEGFARLKQLWPDHFATLKKYHDAGNFTVFPSYEMHSCAHGDYTIVMRELDNQAMPMADTPAGLLAALRQEFGDTAFAFPHHIGYRTGARGINWETFNEELSPVLELISMHGCSESSLVERPFLHSMGPCDGVNTVHNGWNRGHVFGVIGNTDHHSGHPGSYGHGRGAVYAPENTSATIWQALHARQSNALTGDNCHLFGMLDGTMQGGFVSPTADAMLDVEAIGGSAIDFIDVIKNGRIMQRITPAVTPCPIDRDASGVESLLTLELGWGSRGTHHDWIGSLTLEGGEILSLEPRLRGPEVVSPTEGTARVQRQNVLTREGNRVQFDVRSHSNPNNSTPSTQSFCCRVRLTADAIIRAEFGDVHIEVPAERLAMGALSGNLGAIDTPAYRFHPLIRPEQWQWHGRLAAGPLKQGDWVSLRMRQLNGQWAWSSAFFCR